MAATTKTALKAYFETGDTPTEAQFIDLIDSIGLSGGAGADDALLIGWTEAGSYELTSITYDGTYTEVISTGTAKWPDGSAGTFTATTINSTWRAIDAYTISHSDSGQTVTQAAVTRNSAGSVTVKPALTVA